MKQLPRRSFLKALAALPVMNGPGLRTMMAEVKEATSLAAAGVSVGPVTPGYWGYSALTSNKALFAAYKMGLLPDWVKADIDQQTAAEASRLSPDVAALRSVSLSAKFRIQRERLQRNFWRDADRLHGMAMARDAFWSGQNNNPQKVVRLG